VILVSRNKWTPDFRGPARITPLNAAKKEHCIAATTDALPITATKSCKAVTNHAEVTSYNESLYFVFTIKTTQLSQLPFKHELYNPRSTIKDVFLKSTPKDSTFINRYPRWLHTSNSLGTLPQQSFIRSEHQISSPYLS